MNNIVIIGGGASGLVAALYARINRNNKITILERNASCGKKILMTGAGKCNFYNENQNLDNYNSSSKELVSNIINEESTKGVLELFDNLGMEYKTRDGYYYPYSNQALTVKNALMYELKRDSNVEIIENTEVVDISCRDKFYIKSVDKVYKADKVIVATGSKAHVNNSSNIYSILEKMGHEIVPVLPALVQLKSSGKYLNDWAGIRCDAVIKRVENGEIKETEKGEIQLTKYGISGICVFNISGKVSIGLNKGYKEEVLINFLKEKSNYMEYLNNLNKQDKSVVDLLDGILNYKLVNIIINKSKVNPDKLFNELTDRELYNLIENLTNFKVNIIGTNDFMDSQVCSGGISLKDIDLSTMESKKVNGLYIVGELLDIDGKCGGYNLTNAWITGKLAGRKMNE